MQPMHYKKLWIFVTQKRKFGLLFLFITMIMASIAEICSFGILIPFIGAISGNNKNGVASDNGFNFLNIFSNLSVLNLTLAFIVIALVAGSIRVFLLYYQTYFSHQIGLDFSNLMYQKTLNNNYKDIKDKNSSEVISGISVNAEAVVHNFTLPLLTIASSVILTITIILTLYFINKFITIFSVLIFLFIYLAIGIFTKKKLKEAGEDMAISSALQIKLIQEGVGGIRDILIDGIQDVYCREFSRENGRFRKAQANIEFIGATPRFIIEVVGMVLIALAAYFMVESQGDNSAGYAGLAVLAAVAFGAQRLLPLFQQIYHSYSRIKSGKYRLENVMKIAFENNKLIDESIKKLNLAIEFNKNLELKNVTYSYNLNNAISILNNINIVIKRGEKIGVIGKTGAGKSTLLDLLMGLLFPTSGHMLVDGKQIDESNVGGWYRHLSHVPQSIFLVDSTIAENIAFGKNLNQIDYEWLHEVIEIAQLSEYIGGLEKGYFETVGENGCKLSGGQRQRIGIARALYKKPSILILDEATSALDVETESKLISAIDNHLKRVTIVMVAHRLDTLKHCDTIYLLEDRQLKINEI